ncbi:MAG: molecular chaperone TorD family protein [Rhodothermales bacterium]
MPDAEELRRLGGVAAMPRAELGDAHAAAHYRVFVHEAMPVASIYLSADGMMNPDGHISELLAQAAELLDQAAERMDTPQADLSASNSGMLAAFLMEHVSPWLPLQTAAVRRMAVDEETVRWADEMDRIMRAAHAQSTEGQPTGRDHASASAGATEMPPETLLPPVEDILDDPKTSLARIGRHLSLPAQCGLFLTHTDIHEAARSFRVPTGFGSRARSLEGLLRGASAYDALEDVCAVLSAHVDATEARWPEFVGAAWQQAWNDRLAATRLLLERMVTAVAAG